MLFFLMLSGFLLEYYLGLAENENLIVNLYVIVLHVFVFVICFYCKLYRTIFCIHRKGTWLYYYSISRILMQQVQENLPAFFKNPPRKNTRYCIETLKYFN